MLFVNKEHILQQRAMNMRWIQNFTWSLNILIEICITISYTSKHLPTTGRLTIYTLKKINNVWTIRMCAILLHTQSHKHTHTHTNTHSNQHTHTNIHELFWRLWVWNVNTFLYSFMFEMMTFASRNQNYLYRHALIISRQIQTLF